jgi:hypothetical protein
MGSGAGSGGLVAVVALSVAEVGVLCEFEGASCPKDGRAINARKKNERNRSRMRKVNLLGQASSLAISCCALSASSFKSLIVECFTRVIAGGEKVLAAGRPVQLIVFFGVIREILKKEIYRMDK